MEATHNKEVFVEKGFLVFIFHIFGHGKAGEESFPLSSLRIVYKDCVEVEISVKHTGFIQEILVYYARKVSIDGKVSKSHARTDNGITDHLQQLKLGFKGGDW